MSHAVWFIDNGIGIFPIKTRSKEPACRSWDDFVATREDAARYSNYGVRLASWLGVIDTDSPESEAFIALQISSGVIPNTPFVVRGARGLHRYYRLNREHTPKFIKREGLTIEFRNAGQYVVGPGSLHPTGVTYVASEWSWRLTDLPIFPADFEFGGDTNRAIEGDGLAYQMQEVSSGERHDALYKLLRSLKALGNDKESVWWCVQQANENFCSPPLSSAGLRRWFDRGFDASDRPIERVLPKTLKAVGLKGL